VIRSASHSGRVTRRVPSRGFSPRYGAIRAPGKIVTGKAHSIVLAAHSRFGGAETGPPGREGRG
jgi:hypothetical protein